MENTTRKRARVEEECITAPARNKEKATDTDNSCETTDDFDFAFELQMEEAMTDSLLEPQLGEKDPESLELVLKLEQEIKDGHKWQEEMHKVRYDLKLRVHDQKFGLEILQMPEEEWQKNGEMVQKPFVEGSSSSSLAASTSIQANAIDDVEPFKLYFKGLFSNEKIGDRESCQSVTVAAIGAAVCDPRGNLLLNIQKPLVGEWKSDCKEEEWQLKVEVEALMEGLNAALSLDIKTIDYFCDHYPLFQYITVSDEFKAQETRAVLDRLLLLQQKFDSCRPFFVSRKDVKFAFKLARDAIDSQITQSAECSNARNLNETCNICLEDTNVEQMFVVGGCLHRYCRVCMKQHIEAKILTGMVPRCPHEACNTQLDIDICGNFVSSELIDMLYKHMKELSIPSEEKIYCPYPMCSILMSKAEVFPYSKGVSIENDQSAIRKCIRCHGLFCINCKVPWHDNRSCQEYKSSNPNTDADDAKLKSLAKAKSWRQCSKCNFIIELVAGCYHITCRCGYEFCYTCGAEWRRKRPTCSCAIFEAHDDSD